MKQKVLSVLCLVIFHIVGFGQVKQIDSIKVFYLGGQSNMVGQGLNNELPKSLNKTFNNAYIFDGNPVGDNQVNGGLGIWEALKPGHGQGFKSDGRHNNLSKKFGVELSFAKRLQELYPNEKIAVIKYARGATTLDTLAHYNNGTWESDYRGGKGINQYDYFLATIKNAFGTKDINGDGKGEYLIPSGIIWMQGESDAASEDIALRYYSHLKKLMTLMRASLHDNNLPVIIGKISDSGNDLDGKVWNYGELIQYAQEKFVETDVNAAIVRSTKYYKYSDKWHYDSESYIDLGERFADAIYQLLNKSK